MDMVRYCPVCDDEFRPDIKICSDCGEPLILQKEGLGAKGGPSGTVPESEDAWRTALDSLPASALVPARTFDSLADLEPAVAALADLKLPSRVLVQNGRYLLLILPEALAEVQAALHAARVDIDDAPDPTFDAKAGRYMSCPACETQLAENFDGACPGCGLELSGSPGAAAAPEAD